MLKLTGSAMIIAAFGAYGFNRSFQLRERAEMLKKLITALTLLENEIAYNKRDIKTALASIGDTQNIPLLLNASKGMEKTSLKQAFYEEIGRDDIFLKQDKDILKTLADDLGMTDSETQVKSVAYARKRFEEETKNAQNEYEKSGKLYRSMGVLLGILTALILF